MKTDRIMMLTVFLVLITFIGLASVSATYNNTQDATLSSTQSINGSNTEHIKTSDNNIKLEKNINSEKLGAYAYQEVEAEDFEELSSYVEEAKTSTSQYTITLTGEYYDVDDVITWGDSTGNKTLIINGNNKEISPYAYQLFNVNDNHTLIINNLNVTYGFSDEDGGVILNHGNLTINSCYFEENSGSDGGVIWSDGSLTVNNTIFKDNSATNGGVIYISQNTLKNHTSTLISGNNTYSFNSAKKAGVIYNQGKTVINNDSFIENEADKAGVLFNDRNASMSINKSYFEDNDDEDEYGANLVTYTDVEITNTEITTMISPVAKTLNNATLNGVNVTIDDYLIDNGLIITDAMEFKVSNYIDLKELMESIKYVVCEDDHVQITLDGDEYNVTDSITWNPKANHVIILEGNNKVINANNKHFLTINRGSSLQISNLTIRDAQNDNGGAVLSNGTFYLYNTILENNNATNGGAIWSNGTFAFSNCTFHNNSATTGAAIYALKDPSLIRLFLISADSKFTNNSASNSIIYTQANTSIENSIIANNSVGESSLIISTGSLTLNNNIIRDNLNSSKIESSTSVVNNLGVILPEISKIESRALEEIELNLSLKDNNTNNVYSGNVSLVDADGNILAKSIMSDGVATLLFTFNKSYTGNLTLNYEGFNVYPDTSKNIEAEIKSGAYLISINNITSIYNTNTPLTLVLFSTEGILLDDKEVTLNLDTENITSKTTNGIITFNITPKNVGNYTFTAYYNDSSDYGYATTNVALKIIKTDTQITANDITGSVGDTLEIKLNITSNNDSINVGSIIITDSNLNTILTQNITNTTPTVTLQLNNSYNDYLNIQYIGNTNYNNCSTQIKANITKIVTNITLKTSTGKVGDNITITATITDKNQTNITSGTVIFTESGKTIGNTSITNGIANITTKLTKTNNTIQATYIGDNKYASSTKNQTITLNKTNTIVKIANITATLNDTITLTANVTDSNSNKVNTGYVYFRINGSNIKYSNGSDVIAKVSDGVAKANYTIPTSWYTTSPTITAYYNGSENTTTATSNNATIKISLRKVNVTFFADSDTYHAGETVNIRVIVSEDGKLVNSGRVTFKFNGISIKYTNGTTIQVDVKNGIATLKYTLPENTIASKYNFSIVFGGSVYDRTESVTNITILKTDIHVETDPIISSSKTSKITAKIYNGYNQQIKGTIKITVKLNGITVKSNVNITNGIINLDIPTDYKTGLYNVTIIVGENHIYKGTKIETKLLRT